MQVNFNSIIFIDKIKQIMHSTKAKRGSEQRAVELLQKYAQQESDISSPNRSPGFSQAAGWTQLGTPSQQFEGYRQIPTNTISFDVQTNSNDYGLPTKRIIDKKGVVKGNSAFKSRNVPSWVPMPRDRTSEATSDRDRSHSKGFFNSKDAPQPDGSMTKKPDAFQKAGFINFEEYGMAAGTELKHSFNQVDSKQIDREKQGSGSELTENRFNSSVVSFDQDQFQPNKGQQSRREIYQKNVSFENFMQQRSTAFTDFVAQQTSAAQKGPKSMMTGTVSIEENMTPKTPVQPPQTQTIPQDKVKRVVADRIKESIAKFNEKFSTESRSGDLEKLDKKLLREIDLANKIKSLQKDYTERIERVKREQEEFKKSDKKSVVMKQRLSDLLEQSLKIKQSKHSELKQLKHNRVDYLNILSDQSQEQITEGNEEQVSVETERTPVPQYIQNIKGEGKKTPNQGSGGAEEQQFNFTYRDKVAALTGGFDSFSQTIPIGQSLLQQQSSKLTNSVFSRKRKTLNALITSNKDQGASTIDVSQISGPEADPSLMSSRVTFDDAQWKIQTSKILDNNKQGKGSVFPRPLLGQISKVEDPNEFFKRKNQTSNQEPIEQKVTTSGQIDMEPQKSLLVKIDGVGTNLNMNSGNVNFASLNSFQKPMSHMNVGHASNTQRISQISDGLSTVQQSGTKVTDQRSSPISTEEDVMRGPVGGIYSIPFLPMAKLSGYHKADKLREDNTGVLTGVLTGQALKQERGQLTNSVLPEITVGMDRSLHSVKPLTRDNTPGNPELNRGEYEVSNYSQETEQDVGHSNTEANPNTLQGSQAKSSQISSQKNLPDSVHELPRPAVNTSVKHSQKVSMSPNSFNEHNRSGQQQIQVDDYYSKEEFYRMTNIGTLDIKSNISRMSPIPTDGAQLNSFRDERQNGQDEINEDESESEDDREITHQKQIEKYQDLTYKLVGAHEGVAKNLNLGLDKIHLSDTEKKMHQTVRISPKTSPRTLRGNQNNDQGRLQPLRGGGGSLPHGSDHLQTFGYTHGFYSPVRLQKANIYHTHLPTGIIENTNQIDSVNNTSLKSFRDDQRPHLMNQTMRLPNLQPQPIEPTPKMKALEVQQKHKMVSRIGPAGDLYMTMFEKSQKTAQTPFLSNNQKGKWSSAMHSLHQKQIYSNQEESAVSVLQQVLNQKVRRQTMDKKPLKLYYRDLSAVTPRGHSNDDFLQREGRITIRNQNSRNLKFKSKVTYVRKKVDQDQKIDIQLPPGMIAPRGFMGGKDEDSFQGNDEQSMEVVQSNKQAKAPILKKRRTVSKVLIEKPCPPYTKENIFRKRSESEAPQNYPGSEQLRSLHHANLKEMPPEEFRKIVGQLSWKLNPENELRLWELCKEVQLFELLQYGMTREERNAQIEKSRPRRKRMGERTETSALGEGEETKTASALNTNQLNTQVSQTTLKGQEASKTSPTPAGSQSQTALADVSPEQGQYSDHVLHQMKTMTVQQLYELNVLSSIDLTVLAPSLHTKLMEQKNQILFTNKEREKYKEEVRGIIAKIKKDQLQSARSKEALAAVDLLLNMTEEDWEMIRQKGNKIRQVCQNGHGFQVMNDKPQNVVDLSLEKNKVRFAAKRKSQGPVEVTCKRCTRVIQGREQFIHCETCRIQYCKLCMYETNNKKQMELWANFDTILAQMGAKRTLRQLRQEYGHTLPVDDGESEFISER